MKSDNVHIYILRKLCYSTGYYSTW